MSKNTDTQRVDKLAEIMDDNDCVEIDIKQGDEEIKLKRPELQKNGLLPRIIKSLDLMVTDWKYRYTQTGIESDEAEPEYSPELKEAIELLEELKKLQ
jgi:hypothetical protein